MSYKKFKYLNHLKGDYVKNKIKRIKKLKIQARTIFWNKH